MTLFRLDASIRTAGSVSREVADSVERSWAAQHPDARVIRRDVGQAPLSTQSWMTASSAAFTPIESRTDEQLRAGRLAADLADELLDADAYLFAVPLYNYGVPAQFKTWVDLVINDPRFGPGAEQLLKGRPAVLVSSQGGSYRPGTPRDGWDHGTPWERRILEDVFGLDLHLVAAELTLAGVTPAMEALRPAADQSLADAHEAAQNHGLTIAQRVRQAA